MDDPTSKEKKYLKKKENILHPDQQSLFSEDLSNNLTKKKLKFIDGVEDIISNRADEVGFVCRSMVTASMPHSKVIGLQYKRSSKNFSLAIMGNEEAGGIPYGTYPRLILSWLSTEVVKTRSREIILGQSLSEFMKNLGLSVTGGRWGTISRFKEQLKRLFSAHIIFTYNNKAQGQWITTNINIADKTEILWSISQPESIHLSNSKVTLGEVFFEEILKAPIPVDIRAINILKESSLALDIYFWLTYRLGYLKAPLELSFENLQMQFGAGYSDTAQSRYEFKRKFLIQLKKVLAVYREAQVKVQPTGLLIMPSRSHIVKAKN